MSINQNIDQQVKYIWKSETKAAWSSEKRLMLIARIILLAFLLVTIYPVFFVILTAFKSTQEFYINVWSFPRQIAWGNFPYAWGTAHIGEYFINSGIVVVIAVFFILILGALAGYALSRLHIPYSNTILMIILATNMLPSESIIMPLYLMMAKLRIIGQYHSLIIPYIGWGLPLTIYIFKNFFDTIPVELLEAARVDGCNEFVVFKDITVPLMLPALATSAIFNFVGWWGELLWASIVLAVSSLKTVPLGVISFQAQFSTNWGPLSAAICIILLPLIFFFLFVQKYFIQGLTGGSVKG